MKIYRVENENGIGPFHSGLTGKLDNNRRAIWNDFVYCLPCPFNDGIEHHNDCHVCGTRNKKQFNLWFKRVLSDLRDYDYKLVVYIVPKHKVLIGNNQVMFNKSDAIKSENLPL